MTISKRLAKAAWWTVSLQMPRRVRERRAIRAIRASGLFDEDFYLSLDPALRTTAVDPVAHYVRHGANEGRPPSPLFDPSFYRDQQIDVLGAGAEPFVHFVRMGGVEGRSPHPWFDAAFYLEQNPRLRGIGINPLLHYLRVGAATGRDPHPEFETRWYLEAYPFVAEAGLNPLVHYVRWGAAQGLRPNSRPHVSVPGPASRRRIRRPGRARSTRAVVLHLFYPDLWEEICGFLDHLGDDFDLFVSLCPESSCGVEERIREWFPDAEIRWFENRGRDIGPFFELLREGVLSHYEMICKVHSKKSLHRTDGDRWRGNLLHQLLGAPQIIREIEDAFAADPEVGLIGPANQLDRREESWGSNRERMIGLASRMGVPATEVVLEFFAGSMFWARPSALAKLAALDLRLEDFEEERGQLDGTLHHALERLFPAAVRAAGFEVLPFVRPTHEVRLGAEIGNRRVKLIAFYLPQFHPIPENDDWWGPGFTEWSNVVRAKPLYEGHKQPRLPKDLGFYDLRVPETRRSQAELARRYGLHGFCYYYYWFDGHRLLERPLEEVIRSGEPDFPFCVCWANENWTRRWDGLDEDVLIQQSYSEDSARRFIRELIPTFRDPRYIRYQGRPVLVVYRAKAIPKVGETVAIWRAEAASAGIELHLCAVRFWDTVDVGSLGFDAAVDFPPHHLQVRDVSKEVPGLVPDFEGLIYDYGHAVAKNLETRGFGYELPTHRGVMLAWDNTARRGPRAHVAHGATPMLYRKWLTGVLDQDMESNREPESLVFINAWNEWAEGATLEPDDQFGLGFLEATRDSIREVAERWKRKRRR